MKKRLVLLAVILVGITAGLMVAAPAVTLHLGKSYSGNVFGYEKGEEYYAVKPSDNWEVHVYVVLHHNENMYREPTSKLVLTSKNNDFPDSVDYSIAGTDIKGTAQLSAVTEVYEIPHDESLINIAKNMDTLKIRVKWEGEKEIIQLPFLTSFGTRQFPWYLRFMERDFE